MMDVGMEILKFNSIARRNYTFDDLRATGNPNEKQVVRWSEVEPVMKNDEEFQLDDKGRVVYKSAFFLAYPKEASGWKAKWEGMNLKESVDASNKD